jgi:hypothetical protein
LRHQTPDAGTFAFTGAILRVMVDIAQASFEDLAALHEMRTRLAIASQ